MKNVIIPFLITAMFTLNQNICADDIYNFYFQKAPGPQTVIQGGANGQKIGSSKEDHLVEPMEDNLNDVPDAKKNSEATSNRPRNSQPAQSKNSLNDIKEHAEKKWTAHIGKSFYSGPLPDGYSFQLGLERHFNKYISGELVYQSEGNSKWGNESEGQFGSINREPQLFLGISLTPLSLKLFNFEWFEFQLFGGITSVSSNLRNEIFYENPWFDSQLNVVPYTGYGAKINMIADFSVIFRTKSLADLNGETMHHSTSATLAYTF